MASRFWVGGTGTWDGVSTAHWAATTGGATGASVPGAADTVTFDGNSGGGTCTTSVAVSVTSVSATTANTTALTLGAAMTCSGAWSWLAGTFSGSTFNLTASTLTSNGSTTRAVSGTGNFTATSNAGGTVVALTSTGMTLAAINLVISTTAVATRTISLGSGLTLGSLTYTVAPSGGVGGGLLALSYTGATTINTVTVGASRSLQLTASQTLTVTTWAVGGTTTSGSVYLQTPGLSYISTPSFTAGNLTGDLTIDIKCAPDQWASGTLMFLAAKWQTGTTRSWAYYLDSVGKLNFEMTSNGSTAVTVASSVAVVGTDGQPLWLRVTRTKTSGVVTFYTSSDGTTWTQLGTTQTLSAGVAIFTSTSIIEVGSVGAGTVFNLLGSVYNFRMYSDTTQTTQIASADFTSYIDGHATTYTDTQSNVWTTNGPIGKLVYLTSSTGGIAATVSTASTVVFTALSVKDVTFAGAGDWDAIDSVNVSGNSGIDFLKSLASSAASVTTGTAAIMQTYALVSEADSVSTGGVSFLETYILSSEADSVSSGSAFFGQSLAGSGASVSSGNLDVLQTFQLTASGASVSTGSAPVGLTYVLSARGNSFSGSGIATDDTIESHSLGEMDIGNAGNSSPPLAVIELAYVLASTGTSTSLGSTDFLMTYVVSGSGASSSSGTAVFGETIAGSGGSASSGSSDFGLIYALASTGASVSAGTAAFLQTQAISAIGASYSGITLTHDDEIGAHAVGEVSIADIGISSGGAASAVLIILRTNFIAASGASGASVLGVGGVGSYAIGEIAIGAGTGSAVAPFAQLNEVPALGAKIIGARGASWSGSTVFGGIGENPLGETALGEAFTSPGSAGVHAIVSMVRVIGAFGSSGSTSTTVGGGMGNVVFGMSSFGAGRAGVKGVSPSAELLSTIKIDATGAATSLGNADVVQKFEITAQGASTSTGDGTWTEAFTASGASGSSGNAPDFRITANILQASGASVSVGTAYWQEIVIPLPGSSISNGTASFTVTHPLVAVGHSTSSGTGSFIIKPVVMHGPYSVTMVDDGSTDLTVLVTADEDLLLVSV